MPSEKIDDVAQMVDGAMRRAREEGRAQGREEVDSDYQLQLKRMLVNAVIDHTLYSGTKLSEPNEWLLVLRSVVEDLYALMRQRPDEKLAPWHPPGNSPGIYSCRVRGNYCNRSTCAPERRELVYPRPLLALHLAAPPAEGITPEGKAP